MMPARFHECPYGEQTEVSLTNPCPESLEVPDFSSSAVLHETSQAPQKNLQKPAHVSEPTPYIHRFLPSAHKTDCWSDRLPDTYESSPGRQEGRLDESGHFASAPEEFCADCE